MNRSERRRHARQVAKGRHPSQRRDRPDPDWVWHHLGRHWTPDGSQAVDLWWAGPCLDTDDAHMRDLAWVMVNTYTYGPWPGWESRGIALECGCFVEAVAVTDTGRASQVLAEHP